MRSKWNLFHIDSRNNAPIKVILDAYSVSDTGSNLAQFQLMHS